MSTPSPTPIRTQTPPSPLTRALDLLDGLLLRDDVPTPVLLDLGDVFGDLLDVRPPYPPTVPVTSTDAWPVVLDQVAAALHDLITTPDQTTPPARSITYALALRAIRRHQTATPAPRPAGGPDASTANGGRR